VGTKPYKNVLRPFTLDDPELLYVYSGLAGTAFLPSSIAALEAWLNYSSQLNTELKVLDQQGASSRQVQEGRCYDLDGTDDYISIPDNNLLTFGDEVTDSPFSISAWIKADTGTNFRIFEKFQSSGEYVLSVGSGGLLQFTIMDSNDSNRQSIKVNTTWTVLGYVGAWVHVTATYDGSGLSSGMKLYINKVDQTVVTDNAGTYVAMHNTTNEVRIGRFSTTYSNGKMRDVRLYDVELSQANIDGIYDGAVNGNEVVFYKCEETAGTTAYDSSANGLDGTLNNITESSFHATDAGINYSFLNEVGYTDSSGTLIPRDESNTAQDAAGGSLQYFGRVKYSADLKQSFCGHLDGTDDTIEIDGGTTFSFGDGSTDSPFSLSAWINADTLLSARIINKAESGASSDLEWDLLIDSSGRIYAYLYDAGVSHYLAARTGAVLSTGVDYHVVMTYDGSGTFGGIKIYVDKVSQSLTDLSVGSYVAMHSSATQPVYIGSFDATGFRWDGTICDARVHNTELNQTKVDDVYDGKASGSEVGWWPISEGWGLMAHDVTTNGNHGEIKNATLSTFWGTKQDNFHYNHKNGIQGAMYFDGAGDAVNIEEHIDPTSVTLCAWVCFFGQVSQDRIISKGWDGANSKPFALKIRSSTGFKLEVSYYDGVDQKTEGATSLDTFKWYHVAGTIATDGSTEVFVDAVSDGSDSRSSSMPTNDKPICLGARNDGTVESPSYQPQHFNGLMHDARIYDRVLTADELNYIRTDGASGTDPGTTNLKGKWDFEDSSNSGFVKDQSSENADGKIDGDATRVRIPARTNGKDPINGLTITGPAGQHNNNAETSYSLIPAPALLHPKFSHGINFDGSTNHIRITDHNDFSPGDAINDSAFSICALVNMDAATGRIIGKSGTGSNIEWELIITASALRMYMYDGSTGVYVSRGTTAVVTSYIGSWVWFIMTYDGRGGANAEDGIKLYFDEVEQATSDTKAGTYTAMHNTTQNVSIGSYNDGASNFFNGRMADVRYYNKELTVREVLDVVNGRMVSGEVSQWKLNEQSGTTINDSVGAHNGTLLGTTTNCWDTEYPSLFFDKTTGAAKNVTYKDLVANFLAQDRIFGHVATANQKKDLLIHSNKLTGADLTNIETYINIGP